MLFLLFAIFDASVAQNEPPVLRINLDKSPNIRWPEAATPLFEEYGEQPQFALILR